MQDERAALTQYYEDLGWHGVPLGDRVWHSSGYRSYIPLPCQGPMELSEEDRQSLWHAGAWFIRYPVAPDRQSYPSYIFFVDDQDYGFGSVPTKMRTKIRRALKETRVERVPGDVIRQQGMELISDTYDRQGRVFNDRTLAGWRHYCDAVERTPLVEAIGAFVGNELAAFSFILRFRGTVYIEHSFNRRDLLKYHVTNALVFVLVSEELKREDVTGVSFGMRAVMGDAESLNQFKKSMGFTQMPIGERVEVNPRLKPFMDAGLAGFIDFCARLNTARSERAKYVHGLMSTYLNQSDHGRQCQVNE